MTACARVSIPKHSVIQYIRDKQRNAIGVILGTKLPDYGFAVTYAVCHRTDRFKFRKQRAIEIALARAAEPTIFYDEAGLTVSPLSGQLPPFAAKRMLPAFIDRCKKYYKV